ncbi:P-loop containing nucleoside triphosphate hydrolase protein [Phlegmacium glaucopus]|nr:P-loop containing nucleoside triphosphate hydrolase protein [Phlegmacium glaucopus]
MDSNDLERERGITILYNAPVSCHADFGGEVERVMSMVDGVALIVDATEGPMTQTRFVLSKALRRGLRPLVVLNKADRPTCRPEQVESATDDQADYPLLYASAKQGWAQDTLPQLSSPSPNMTPLFDLIMSHVPPPNHLERTSPFSMLTIQIEADPYVGMLYLGRIQSGVLKIGDTLERVGEGKVKKFFGRRGLRKIRRVQVKCQSNGGGGVNVTLIHPEGWVESGPQALPTTPIDPPTISIHVFTNDSPLAGKEGTKLTSQVIRERIYKEAETNVCTPCPFPILELRGRGVLHLGVLLETLRREGFELEGNRKGAWLEPIEECTVVVWEEYAGGVVQKLTLRKGEMKSYESGDPEEGWFRNDVHGQGTINHIFKGYESYKGAIDTGRNGALISMALGESSGYAMAPLQVQARI